MSEKKHPLLNSLDAVVVAKGIATERWQAQSVSIDSRTLKKNALFVAIEGDRFNGHDFVLNALAKGASAAVVNKRFYERNKNLPLLAVSDTHKALNDLAKYNRGRAISKIIAVTGSVGKTTVKNMLHHILSKQDSAFCTPGNLNNHYGVPLSLSNMTPETSYGIFEIGMNHASEIMPLTEIVAPDIAIITEVSDAHSEFFNSVKDIAKAKAEIFFGLKQNGVAILNHDNEFFDFLKNEAKKLHIKNIISFGEHNNADAKLISYSRNKVTANILGEEVTYNLSINGKHNALNSVIALLSIKIAGADLKQALQDIENFKADKGRGETHQIKIKSGEFLLIDESYNASPTSVKAAISLLNKSENSIKGKTILVLGDMLELGDEAEQLHKNLKKDIVKHKIDKVITVGDLSKSLHNCLPSNVKLKHYTTCENISDDLYKTAANQDVILVKGSNSIGLKRIIDDLVKM